MLGFMPVDNRLLVLLKERQGVVKAIASLNEHILKIDDEISSRTVKLLDAFGLAADTSPRQVETTGKNQSVAGEHEITTKRKRGSVLAEPILRILKERGPLTSKEIYNSLVESGVQVGGMRPEANVAAHLHHIDDVEKNDQKQWFIKNNAHG